MTATSHTGAIPAERIAPADAAGRSAAASGNRAAPFITASGLRKSFQMGTTVVHALAGVDIAIEAGTFQTIMGPSGSGKSTLLYLLGGLDRPTAGRIIVGGHVVNEMDENALAAYRRRFVGFIFQSFNLIPSLSAWENVAFPMRFAGVSRRERQKRAFALLERVGLADRRDHKPTELSGGQQQRVAIARSLVNEPRLVLADEPTGNLDTASGQSIMDLLAELHRDGRTVLVVTHDPRMAAYATHRVFLLDGCIVSEEKYREVAGVI
ncbi:MAG: ABC transporter ATP-binding protein [Anaerolineae bacterium]|nr:ABC transporter ATP-binding protein [Anaerolineae bacterium]RIK19449.1 MAG: macrolide ABC transporter ATP-binding protein [Anaerolineae bacterium]